MAKIAHLLACLAVCQYAAAAEDNTAAAAAILQDNAPVLISVLYGIRNIVDALPTAEQVDRMVAEGVQAVEEIVEQLGAAGDVVEQIRRYAPILVRRVIHACTETVVKTVYDNLQSDQAQQIARLIANVTSALEHGVKRAAGVAAEAVDCVERAAGIEAVTA